MYVTYLVVTILAAAANGYAASLDFAGAESVKLVADRVQVSGRCMVPLGVLLDEREWLTECFQQHRPHLRAVAYRMLGSVSEAEDALQEAWLRVHDRDPAGVENTRAWLTTVVGRVCLNLLRARVIRRHRPPLERSEAAAQQLASRARRRLRNSPEPDRDLARQRSVVGAFFAASRDGDFDALLEVLDPDVELRIDGGALRADASLLLRGADAVAAHTATYSRLYPFVRPALVNGAAGAVVAPGGHVFSVMAFTVADGRIVQIDALLDPERLAQLDLRIPPMRDQAG